VPLGGAWLTPRGGFKPRRGAARGAILSGQGRSALRGCVVAMAAAGASGLYVNPNTGAAQAGLMPFRNALINGDMRINQRGTSTNLASMTALGAGMQYVCDRWGVYRTGYATGGQTAQGTNLTTGDLPFNEAGITTFARVGRVLSNALTNAILLSYALETQDSVKFKGKNVTVSGYYRTGANFSGSQLVIETVTGTGTDEGIQRGSYITGGTNYQLSLSLNTNWSKFTYTTKLATTTNQVAVNIIYSPTGTAGANDYFDITGVQLELGSVATPFEVRPYPVELQLCQRYYVRWVATLQYSHFPLFGYVSTTNTSFNGTIITQTNLRIAPSISSQFSSSGAFTVLSGNSMSVSSMSIDTVSNNVQCFRINIIGSAGTTGQSGVLRAENSIGAYIAIDVEL